jgi:hypothetical protein
MQKNLMDSVEVMYRGNTWLRNENYSIRTGYGGYDGTSGTRGAIHEDELIPVIGCQLSPAALDRGNQLAGVLSACEKVRME